MSKGRSGRRIANRTQENIEAVRQALERNQGRISARRNGLGVSPSSFCRIIKKDLRWYPYKMIRRHNLTDGDYERHFRFCQWFLHQCNNRRFLVNFVIGAVDGFTLNGAVNNHNERMYASENQPSDFHYNVKNSRQNLTVWAGLCGNGDMLNPFFLGGNWRGDTFDDSVISKSIPWKSISTFVVGSGWVPLPWIIGSLCKTKPNFLEKEF